MVIVHSYVNVYQRVLSMDWFCWENRNQKTHENPMIYP